MCFMKHYQARLSQDMEQIQHSSFVSHFLSRSVESYRVNLDITRLSHKYRDRVRVRVSVFFFGIFRRY